MRIPKLIKFAFEFCKNRELHYEEIVVQTI